MKVFRLAIHVFAVFAMSLVSAGAWAQDASPVGLWKNIDDKSGRPRALIRITEDKGELSGKIEKLFQEAGQEPNPKCEKCQGALREQPIIGMVILSGFRRTDNEYLDGRVLDPDNGQSYKSKLALIDGGKKLQVRGYIGVPWIGRSQVWLREE